MKTLIKNGNVILDGTASRAEKEKEAFLELESLQNLQEEFGIDFRDLCDNEREHNAFMEIENNNEVFFCGDAFYGHYSKESWLDLIKDMLYVYKKLK